MALLAASESAEYALSSPVLPAGLGLVGVRTPAILRLAVPLDDEELMRFSAENVFYRIERSAVGELHIMSPSGGLGGRGEAYLIRQVDLWAEEHGGVSFSSQAGFRLPDTSVKMADVAWVESDRWASLSHAQQRSYPPLCPAFVIELLSPPIHGAAQRRRWAFGSRTASGWGGSLTRLPRKCWFTGQPRS